MRDSQPVVYSWARRIDRLRTLRSYGLVIDPRVVTIDVDQSQARDALGRADPLYAGTIHLVETSGQASRRSPGVGNHR